jgi:hypothetical protein
VTSETAQRVLGELRDRGMLLQSARGPIPNVAELVAREPIKGSWWGHRAGHEIFAVLWPALVRVADRFPTEALAAITEEHTPSGAHRTTTTAFPDWVPEADVRAGQRLAVADALGQLPECLTKR